MKPGGGMNPEWCDREVRATGWSALKKQLRELVN